MSRHEQPGYDKQRAEEGFDIAYSKLGGPYVSPQTGRFNPGHEDRVEEVRDILDGLGLSPTETDKSIAHAEIFILDDLQQDRWETIRKQAGWLRQLDG